MKGLIIDKRMSRGYYSYCLELIVNGQHIDTECYGEGSLWGMPDSKRFDHALEELLRRNNLARNDVVIKSCGGVYQRPCEEDEEEDEEE
ncbi:hypothetical protein [Pyrobaculum sp.]|uniref:hypothetical protein n=1 Tax=Pyrobaculum sp. TaxID=2004705 RepID=UPI00317EA22E